jgi:NAD(P)-dependent dehydrogenase (short-subunit alcohol dehydrogenase family)
VESTLEAFDKVNGVNYRGLWMCVREQLKMMKEQEISEREGMAPGRGQRGSIVNIASQLGIVGRPNSCKFSFFGLALLTI